MTFVSTIFCLVRWGPWKHEAVYHLRNLVKPLGYSAFRLWALWKGQKPRKYYIKQGKTITVFKLHYKNPENKIIKIIYYRLSVTDKEVIDKSNII